jgi:ribosomal protein L16/L10AE
MTRVRSGKVILEIKGGNKEKQEEIIKQIRYKLGIRNKVEIKK